MLEEKFPGMTGEFKDILKEQYLTFCLKQWDYGPSNIAVGTNLETPEEVKMSWMGLWFRINDKVQRLKNILFNDKTAANEPMIDAFMDMSVYGIIAQIVDRGKWGK
jgi:hypothetical protein